MKCANCWAGLLRKRFAHGISTIDTAQRWCRSSFLRRWCATKAEMWKRLSRNAEVGIKWKTADWPAAVCNCDSKLELSPCLLRYPLFINCLGPTQEQAILGTNWRRKLLSFCVHPPECGLAFPRQFAHFLNANKPCCHNLYPYWWNLRRWTITVMAGSLRGNSWWSVKQPIDEKAILI